MGVDVRGRWCHGPLAGHRVVPVFDSVELWESCDGAGKPERGIRTGPRTAEAIVIADELQTDRVLWVPGRSTVDTLRDVSRLPGRVLDVRA